MKAAALGTERIKVALIGEGQDRAGSWPEGQTEGRDWEGVWEEGWDGEMANGEMPNDEMPNDEGMTNEGMTNDEGGWKK